MTKSNEINILRADHVVGLSQASIGINIDFEILLLGGRALPSINPTPIVNPKFQSYQILILDGRALPSIIPTPIGNPKFQSSQIPILTADLESAEKTVN